MSVWIWLAALSAASLPLYAWHGQLDAWTERCGRALGDRLGHAVARRLVDYLERQEEQR